jgi:hypothetical protein
MLKLRLHQWFRNNKFIWGTVLLWMSGQGIEVQAISSSKQSPQPPQPQEASLFYCAKLLRNQNRSWTLPYGYMAHKDVQKEIVKGNLQNVIDQLRQSIRIVSIPKAGQPATYDLIVNLAVSSGPTVLDIIVPAAKKDTRQYRQSLEILLSELTIISQRLPNNYGFWKSDFLMQLSQHYDSLGYHDRAEKLYTEALATVEQLQLPLAEGGADSPLGVPPQGPFPPSPPPIIHKEEFQLRLLVRFAERFFQNNQRQKADALLDRSINVVQYLTTRFKKNDRVITWIQSEVAKIAILKIKLGQREIAFEIAAFLDANSGYRTDFNNALLEADIQPDQVAKMTQANDPVSRNQNNDKKLLQQESEQVKHDNLLPQEARLQKLLTIAIELYRQEKYRQGDQVLIQAEQLARGFANPFRRFQMQSQIVEALARSSHNSLFQLTYYRFLSEAQLLSPFVRDQVLAQLALRFAFGGSPKRGLEVALLIPHPERRVESLYALLQSTMNQGQTQELIDEILKNMSYPEWKAVSFFNLAEDAFGKVQNDRALTYLSQATQNVKLSPKQIKVHFSSPGLGTIRLFSSDSIFREIALLYAKLQRHSQADALSQSIQNPARKKQTQQDIHCYR